MHLNLTELYINQTLYHRECRDEKKIIREQTGRDDLDLKVYQNVKLINLSHLYGIIAISNTYT